MQGSVAKTKNKQQESEIRMSYASKQGFYKLDLSQNVSFRGILDLTSAQHIPTRCAPSCALGV
jgi:hypothetical protein